MYGSLLDIKGDCARCGRWYCGDNTVYHLHRLTPGSEERSPVCIACWRMEDDPEQDPYVMVAERSGRAQVNLSPPQRERLRTGDLSYTPWRVLVKEVSRETDEAGRLFIQNPHAPGTWVLNHFHAYPREALKNPAFDLLPVEHPGAWRRALDHPDFSAHLLHAGRLKVTRAVYRTRDAKLIFWDDAGGVWQVKRGGYLAQLDSKKGLPRKNAKNTPRVQYLCSFLDHAPNNSPRFYATRDKRRAAAGEVRELWEEAL